MKPDMDAALSEKHALMRGSKDKWCIWSDASLLWCKSYSVARKLLRVLPEEAEAAGIA